MVARGLPALEVGEMGEGSQKVQTSSFKISMSHECNVQCGEVNNYVISLYGDIS